MARENIEFRTHTSPHNERIFTVQQQRVGDFLLDQGFEETKKSVLLRTQEHGPGVYEIHLEKRAVPIEAAMLVNAAFQNIAIEDGLNDRKTDTFALVETTNFLEGHRYATLYEEALGMEAVALTRRRDEAIMLGGSTQEVNGNATWTLHDTNIFRVT